MSVSCPVSPLPFKVHRSRLRGRPTYPQTVNHHTGRRLLLTIPDLRRRRLTLIKALPRIHHSVRQEVQRPISHLRPDTPPPASDHPPPRNQGTPLTEDSRPAMATRRPRSEALLLEDSPLRVDFLLLIAFPPLHRALLSSLLQGEVLPAAHPALATLQLLPDFLGLLGLLCLLCLDIALMGTKLRSPVPLFLHQGPYLPSTRQLWLVCLPPQGLILPEQDSRLRRTLVELVAPKSFSLMLEKVCLLPNFCLSQTLSVLCSSKIKGQSRFIELLYHRYNRNRNSDSNKRCHRRR